MREDDLLAEAVELIREFRREWQPFITAFEADSPWTSDGEDLAERMDAFLGKVSDG